MTFPMGGLVRLLDRLGFEKLASFCWNWQLYRCVKCGDVLRRFGEGFSCMQCGVQFPIVNGVPILVRGLRVTETSELPSEASLKAVCTVFQTSDDDVALQHLRSVFGKVYRFENSFLEAENNCLLRRLLIDPEEQSTVDDMARQGSGVCRFAVVHHYIPSELPCATLSSHNVRIRNTGERPLTRYSLGGWQIRGRWTDAAGQDLGDAGKPSRLPVSVSPARELTIPFWLNTPSAAGEYRLAFSLIAGDEEVCDSSAAVPVRISESVTRDYEALEPTVGPLQPDNTKTTAWEFGSWNEWSSSPERAAVWRSAVHPAR